MDMQKYAIFVENSLKMNMLKTKNMVKLEIIVIIQVNIESIMNTVNIFRVWYT